MRVEEDISISTPLLLDAARDLRELNEIAASIRTVIARLEQRPSGPAAPRVQQVIDGLHEIAELVSACRQVRLKEPVRGNDLHVRVSEREATRDPRRWRAPS